MKPYLKDRVKTPYSDKTVGTVTKKRLSEAGNLVCLSSSIGRAVQGQTLRHGSIVETSSPWVLQWRLKG